MAEEVAEAKSGIQNSRCTPGTCTSAPMMQSGRHTNFRRSCLGVAAVVVRTAAEAEARVVRARRAAVEADRVRAARSHRSRCTH